MGLSLPHILLLAVVAVLLLGGGRFSALMGDVAKGVKQFKKGMADTDEDDRPAPPRPAPRLQAQQPIEPPVIDPAYPPAREERPHE
jgi:sec-independent protein translocase protein TatA